MRPTPIHHLSSSPLSIFFPLAGVLFEDDYNYSQHLKTRGGEGADIYEADPKAVAKMENALEEKAKGLGIPSDLLPSEYEEEVGMLNLAAYVFLFFFPIPPPPLYQAYLPLRTLVRGPFLTRTRVCRHLRIL